MVPDMHAAAVPSNSIYSKPQNLVYMHSCTSRIYSSCCRVFSCRIGQYVLSKVDPSESFLKVLPQQAESLDILYPVRANVEQTPLCMFCATLVMNMSVTTYRKGSKLSSVLVLC
jgi:hypothetical protein